MAKPETNPRLVAVKVLTQVVDKHRSLATVLEPALKQLETSQRPLAQELCYGVLRFYFRLDALAATMLERPLRSRDLDIHSLILVGLYQLLYTRVPDHAAVDETVAVTGRLKKAWARGMVNALLRRFLRERDALLADLEQDDEARTAHPQWLLQQLQQDWPEHWQRLAESNNQRPPMSLRVNLARQSRDDYAARLQAAGIAYQLSEVVDSGVTLDSPLDVTQLPGFTDGDVSVQDCAAQLAASLLDLQPGQRVLDACAAPGGKTAHILETLQAGGDRDPGVVAVDHDATRLARVDDTLGRLGLSAELKQGDALRPDDWRQGESFDRILLDAPCSASGVIRRHPDIKLLRQAEDIPALARVQGEMLDAMWPLLTPGGMLLYATCSVFAAENHQVVAGFVARTADAREHEISASWGVAQPHGRQILSGEQNMDGFYYARLKKNKT